MNAVDKDLLIEQLVAVRRIVDEALRVLAGDGTPPLPTPPARSAEIPLPSGCKHNWALAGFGSTMESCSICGAKRGVS